MERRFAGSFRWPAQSPRLAPLLGPFARIGAGGVDQRHHGQAEAVGHLADRIRGKGDFVASWPDVNYDLTLGDMSMWEHESISLRTGERVVPNDATTWHRSAEWLRPSVRTIFEMVNDAVPQGNSPRTASINEAIDRGAD